MTPPLAAVSPAELTSAGPGKLAHLSVAIGARSVPYVFGHHCAEALITKFNDLLEPPDAVLLVADANAHGHVEEVRHLLARHYRVESVSIRAEEKRKTLAVVSALIEVAVARGLTRRSVVVAMGGGIIGNIAGMTAALLFRGVRLVHLPTTPVAAFDAVLSQKQAVNSKRGKNMAGTYHSPTLIACDLAWLESVRRPMLMAGLAEMAKNVVTVVPELEGRYAPAIAEIGRSPHTSLEAMLRIGIAAKAPYLAADPSECASGLVFEYGHTVGHAVEFASRGRISHGEAIAYGMLVAAEVSMIMRAMPPTAAAYHRRLLAPLGVIGSGPGRLNRSSIHRALRADNKRGLIRSRKHEVPMVLLEDVGIPAVADGRPLVAVPLAVIDAAMELLPS